MTIKAANYAGAATWAFNIEVPSPPPAAVSNLSVGGVTESSVTLAWSPEDASAGPVTYSVWLRHSIHDPKGSGGTVWYTQIGSSTNQTNITIDGLAAGLSQAYYVEARGPGGVSGYASVGATTRPAPAPGNLRVTALTPTTLTLAWDAPAGGLPLASYRLIGVFNGVFVQYPLDYLGISGPAFTITGLSSGTSILWGVAALDSAGNVSSYTYLPSLVTNPVPVAPKVNASVRLADGSFRLTLEETGAVLQTVLIEVSTSPGDPAGWIQIGSILPSAGVFTFIDPDASRYPSRFYRVTAP